MDVVANWVLMKTLILSLKFVSARVGGITAVKDKNFFSGNTKKIQCQKYIAERTVLK